MDGGGVLRPFSFANILVMTKNLETADTIVKFILAITTIILFFAAVISGPFAVALVILSALILLIQALKLLYKIFFLNNIASKG